MIQQVLIFHPNSAKAYLVQAELYARQGNLARAREALRAQLAARSAAGTGPGGSAVHYAASPCRRMGRRSV